MNVVSSTSQSAVSSPVMSDATRPCATRGPSRPNGENPLRLGVVRYANTLPLIDGLDPCRDLCLVPQVPADLVGALERGDVDAALCSSIDQQRTPLDVVVLPAGQLGCDGATMTVRLYSKRPFSEVDTVACDSESHTSVALLRVLMAERFGVGIETVPFSASTIAHGDNTHSQSGPEAMLLIGDKVVLEEPSATDYPHQVDLGDAWKRMTGLPFVFALWLAPTTLDAADRTRLQNLLERQRLRNATWRSSIVARSVVPRGWPQDVAEDYLMNSIRYEFTAESQAGLSKFYELCVRHGVLDTRKPFVVHGAS